jgi:glycosyltransferase involved in cell wall biosynthesis
MYALKIAFIIQDGMDRFVRDLESHFQAQGHEVRRMDRFDPAHAQQLLEWADLAWLEWCLSDAITITQRSWNCRIVIRLHSLEALHDAPKSINWANVDDLIFVAPHIRDMALEQAPDLTSSTNVHVIPIGVDLERCTYKKRRPGFHLASLGYINYKKGPMLLLHCFERIFSRDKRYHLHLAGTIQNRRYSYYFKQMATEMGMGDNLHLHGWVEDVDSFLDGMHYLVVTSPLESGHMGVREAMARGIKPLIHNFYGARRLYPDEYIFNTIGEFTNQVMSPQYDSQAYRSFIENNYAMKDYLARIDRLVNRGS